MFQSVYVTHPDLDNTPESMVYLWDDKEGLLIYPYRKKFGYAYKFNPDGEYETIFGDPVDKVYRWGKNSPVYEKDIPKETRVLTDIYLHEDDISTGHKLMVFDIETDKDSNGQFSDVTTTLGQITQIVCWMNTDNKYVVFMLQDNKGKNCKIDMDNVRMHLHHSDIDSNMSIEVIASESEIQLLNAFKKYYRKNAPTMLTGWNISGYDIPYLINRLRLLHGSDDGYRWLSPVKHVRYNPWRNVHEIAGVNILDYLLLYKKFTYTQRPSYKLNSIGLYEVNMGKISYEGTLQNLRLIDLSKYIAYNIRDVQIIVELDRKLKLIQLIQGISHVSHTRYEDYQYSSKFIEGTIITYLHRNGKVATNKKEIAADFQFSDSSREARFSGAYVKEPIPDRYEWIYNLDLQSLYPSIIMGLNISPETKIGKITNWDSKAYHKNKQDLFHLDGVGDVSKETLRTWMNDEKLIIASNGVIYRSPNIQKGVIPEILNEWFNKRIEYKQLMKQYKHSGDNEKADYYDRLQHVQKILLNSIYGVSGLPSFRFYELDNAEAVTTVGQDVIKMSAKYLNRKYQELLGDKKDHCIYCDTDSVYFSAVPLFYHPQFMTSKDNTPLSMTINVAKYAESQLNKFYDIMSHELFGCESHRFYMKGEAIGETAIWIAKKRYAIKKVYDLETGMEVSPPKLAIKGLDIVRSSFPKSFQEFMTDILTQILNKEDKSIIDEHVLRFKTKLKQLPFSEIAKNTSVSDIRKYEFQLHTKNFSDYPKGCPAHVKASLAYNRWISKFNTGNATIKNGDKIKWAYLKDNPYNIPTMALKGDDDPTTLVEYVSTYIDYDTIFKKELHNKIEQFYTSLGWGKIPTDMSQLADEFFSFED